MRDDLTDITVILDRSGSMSAVRSDVVGGFNQFLDEQKKCPGEAMLTLVQFDSGDPYEVLRNAVPVQDVQPLGDEYQPRASTPLYDAVGRGIVETGSRLAAIPEADRPGKVVFVILTDGMENASREYTKERVAAMTKEQQEKYSWQFVYLGANQDAMMEGAKFGVDTAMAATYASNKTGAALRASSKKVASYRTGPGGQSIGAWTDKERDELA